MAIAGIGWKNEIRFAGVGVERKISRRYHLLLQKTATSSSAVEQFKLFANFNCQLRQSIFSVSE